MVGSMRQTLRQLYQTQFRMLAGLAFMLAAMAAIEYDEIIAPEMNRISDAWGSVATDFSRRLASFTL